MSLVIVCEVILYLLALRRKAPRGVASILVGTSAMVIFDTDYIHGAKRSDGQWFVYGWDRNWGPTFFDASGQDILQVDAGHKFCAVLRRNGQVEARGHEPCHQFAPFALNLPVLPPGMKYKQVACGNWHTVVLRDDGMAYIANDPAANLKFQMKFPANVTFREIAAFEDTSVGYREDGGVSVVGAHKELFKKLPRLPKDVKYVQIVGGMSFICALRSDGICVCANDLHSELLGEVIVAPSLPNNTYYVQIGAGVYHAVFLRSDGRAFCRGGPFWSDTRTVPNCPKGLKYVGICVGSYRTLFLRSDGNLIRRAYCLRSVFPLSKDTSYLSNSRLVKTCLTVRFEQNGRGGVLVYCSNTGGESVAEILLSDQADLTALRIRLASLLRISQGSLELVSSQGVVTSPGATTLEKLAIIHNATRKRPRLNGKQHPVPPQQEHACWKRRKGMRQ